MGLGYSYTLASGDTAAPPVMTGHAREEAAARRIVEMMLARDETIFCGVVRDLSAPGLSILRCMRSRSAGLFVWSPVNPPLAAPNAARLS